jgi:glucoamylase
MAQRRQGQFPHSWGAWTKAANTGLNATQCNGTSHNSTGTYKPALAAGAPNISTACASEVIFSVNATTAFGQNVFLAGNTTELGGALNNPAKIILPLNPGNYSSRNPQWFVDIWLPAGVSAEYQYVLQQKNGTYTFEAGPTRHLTAGSCGSGKVVRVDEVARFPSS